MSASDGGSALAVPPGDPEGVRQGARALTRAAGAMDANARRTTDAGLSAASVWHGVASRSYVARTTDAARGLRALGDGFARAGRALEDFAEALADAQRRARTAQADATASADHALRVARAQAGRRAEQAQEDVDAAARRCSWQLREAADSLRATTMADLLDWLGGPDTAFGLLGLFGQGVTAKGLHDARKALLAGDLVELARIDPTGYQRAMQAAAQYGDESLEAVSAQLRWQAGVMPKLIADMSDAALPLQGLPTGQPARALDLLAKAGVVTSVVSNAWTVFGPDPDGKNTGLDKGMALADTAGLGLAATGGATAMGLVGLSASVGWVPVAGQVVMAVTAAYLAYDRYRDNEELVHDLAGRVGAGVGRAAEWTQQELQEYADEVRRELETARDAVVGVAQGGVELARGAREAGEELLADAGELARDARDRAAGVVSAVNPFD